MASSYPSALDVNPPPSMLADLPYATALAGAAERMGESADLDQLWPRLTEEALSLVAADGAVVVERRARLWSLLAVRAADGATSVDQAELGVVAADRRGLLTDSATAADDDLTALPDGWRSVLVVPLDRRPSRVSTRLLWFSGRPDGLHAYAELADLLGRHASAAVRNVDSRVGLGHAVEARNRIGQAQGILMARYRITAEQAFAVLVRQSQDTNTKLRSLADEVILTGRLDGVS